MTVYDWRKRLGYTDEDVKKIERNLSGLNETQAMISEECDALKAMLLEKNKNYGDSAVDPIMLFSGSDVIEQINVRVDDKIKRLKNMSVFWRAFFNLFVFYCKEENCNFGDEDTVSDLIGYLVLRRVAKKKKLLDNSSRS